MFGEIITLFKMLSELVSKKKELDKSYFNNFIEPIWEVFEKSHISYKTSFQKYTEFISGYSTKKDELLEMIKRDSIYSRDFSYQIVGLIENIPPVQFKAKEKHLYSFLTAILNYFDVHARFTISDKNKKSNNSLEIVHTTNLRVRQARALAYLEISQNIKEGMISETIEILDSTVQDLQSRYEKVAKSYYALKKDLLT